MHALAIVLNVLGLLAALAVSGALGLFLSVMFHGKRLQFVLSLLVGVPVVFAVPTWGAYLAFTWADSGGHTAVFVIPSLSLLLGIPLAGLLFVGMEAAARP